jgi:CRP-like cAMP-binding protein
MHLADLWFVSAFRADRGVIDSPVLCRVERSIVRRLGGGVVLRPRGPRSCPSYAVSNHHHLIDPIRPTREHIAISAYSGLYAMPSLCALGPGEMFGTVSLFTDGRYPADAITLSETLEASWSEDELLDLMASYPAPTRWPFAGPGPTARSR